MPDVSRQLAPARRAVALREYAPRRRSTSRAQTCVGLLLARRLDHHPDQRLGARRAHEHAAAAAERIVAPRSIASLTAGCVHRARQRRAVRGADVDEPLGELLHRVAVVEVAAAERLERQQRARDPVARRPEAEVDDVAGLLAAERSSRAGAARRARSGRRRRSSPRRSPPPPSRCGSRSWSSP